MAKNSKKVSTNSGVKGVIAAPANDKLELNVDDTTFRKPGKVRTGKMVDGELVYDDESEAPEAEVVTPPAPDKPKKTEKLKTEVEDSKGSVKVEDGVITLKPSQRPTLPAHQRKVVEKPKDGKEFIVINDLVSQFGMDGKKIRRIIRNIGYKAPATHDTGFGAKARYEIEVGSLYHKAILKALNEEKA